MSVWTAVIYKRTSCGVGSVPGDNRKKICETRDPQFCDIIWDQFNSVGGTKASQQSHCVIGMYIGKPILHEFFVRFSFCLQVNCSLNWAFCTFIIMDLVVRIYDSVLGCIMILTFCRIARGVSYMLSAYFHHYSSTDHCRRLFIGTLIYRISHKGSWSWLPSPIHLICAIIYLVWTGVCDVWRAQSIHQAGFRAAHLAMINLVPVFLSGGSEFGASLLGSHS